MAEAPLQYWDSVVFIAYLKGEPGRVDLVRTLLRHVEQGRIRLATSTFTIAEVRCFSTDQTITTPKNNPDHERRVQELFDSDLIEFWAVTHFIAREAVKIGCSHNALSPADCIHIATAIDFEAASLLTWDGSSPPGKRSPTKMLTYNKRLGSPPLEIVEPFDPYPSLGLSDGSVGTKSLFPLPQPGTQPAEES
jgi:predicted nucleic acid-binding protein